MTPAQFRSAAQKGQRDLKRAVDDHNRQVKKFNTAVDQARREQKRAVENYNREARTYNAKVRAHNQRVDSQRRRLDQEIRRLNSRPTTTTFTDLRSTTTGFVRTYEIAERSLAGSAGIAKQFLDLTSDEAANTVYLLNALDGDGSADQDMTEDELRGPSLAKELSDYGQDLVNRWTGALFALSPHNPDAARHFCTSAREVVITMLDRSAPDAVVLRDDPDCEVTDKKVPTRRAKISYLLSLHGVASSELANAVKEDVDNVLSLFRIFNDGTHGHAGRFNITELTAIRIRVEGAVSFIHRLVSAARASTAPST